MIEKEKILIVGAQGHIGTTVKKTFEEKGYFVLGTSTKGTDGFELLDLCSNESIENFCINCPNLISGIIFCSGLEPKYNTLEMTRLHFDKMMEIHLKGPYFLIKNILPKLQKGACIVFVSSIAANLGSYDPSYSIVKGGVNSLIKSMAREFAGLYRFNAVAPSLVENSTVFIGMSSDFRERHLNNTLNKQFLKAEEIALLINTIVEIKHINGQIFHINGGQYFGN
jgi:NAD(P)-dependent dehydrogenase (short-subunit alcohol dehydrogenase family)